jgi:hypothetical protein
MAEAMLDEARPPEHDEADQEDSPVPPVAGSLFRRTRQSSDQSDAPAFPDLPPELVLQRPDGTGPFTREDIDEMRRKGTTARLAATEAQRAEQAIEHLRRKMADITTEFNEGRINQAQFEAIYTRYGEQMAVIKAMLEQNPLSDAWQQVADEGSTGFLRRQHAARARGFVLCDNLSGEVMHRVGHFDLQSDLLVPILSDLGSSAEALGGGQRSTQIEGGRWLCIVPGERTTTIVLFSAEPSAEQLETAVKTHRDFERANRRALKSGRIDTRHFVFPQRELFEEEE